MLGHYMPAAMMGGRDPQTQQNPMHQQQQQQQHLLSQQHLQQQQQQQHHNPQQQQPQQQHHGIQQQHQGQGQQGQFGPQYGGGVGPPPPNGQDMSLASVLHYLQTEWRRYERERNEWEIERAEMRVSAPFVSRRVFG